MPRIIVTTDPIQDRPSAAPREGASVLLNERVDPVHLSDDHAAEQLIERLAWAVSDAAEGQRSRCREGRGRSKPRPCPTSPRTRTVSERRGGPGGAMAAP